MERVKNIFGTFFDINAFSVTRLLVAIGFLVGFFVLKGILSTVIIKIVKKKHNGSTKNSSLYKPLKWLFTFLGLYIALQILCPTPLLQNIMKKTARLLIIVLLTYTFANMFGPNSKFERVLKRRLNKANDQMVKMICKVVRVFIVFLGVVILLSELGYNINGLIAGLGIGGVAIALAAQDTASNIIGALMIILDKPFEVGDWVTVGDKEGTIEEFTFRSTRIRESQNCVVSIPNSKVVDSVLTNWSKLEKRRILINIVLEFSTPLKKVADVQNEILMLLEQDKNIIQDGSASVKFDEIKDDGYDLRIFGYTPIIPYGDYLEYMNSLNFKIMSILQDNKVNLAYKSETVYIKK